MNLVDLAEDGIPPTALQEIEPEALAGVTVPVPSVRK